MTNARISDAGGESEPRTWATSPQLNGLLVGSGLLFLGIGLVTVLAAFQFASICTVQLGFYESIATAVGVLVTGVAFNWLSLEVVLAGFFPAAWGLSATVSILVWFVIMASTIQAVSSVLSSERVTAAFVTRLAVAAVLVAVYAASSALGFCVISRTWM